MKRLTVASIALFAVVGCQDTTEPTIGAPVLDQVQVQKKLPPEVIVGPRFVKCRTSTPVQETYEFTIADFEHYEQPFSIRVANGSPDGSGRASIAEVWLGEELMFGPSDFAPSGIGPVRKLLKSVTPDRQSTLGISVESCPAYVLVWIEAKLKPGRARIGPEGGQVVSPMLDVTLTVPQNALPNPALVWIETVPAPDTHDTSLVAPASTLVHLQPDDLEFDVPVEISITTLKKEGERPALFEFRPSDASLVWHPSWYDDASSSLHALISHFSYWVPGVVTPIPSGDRFYSVTGGDQLDGVAFDAAVKRSLAGWLAALNGAVHLESTSQEEDADLVFRAVPIPREGEDFVLGHRYYDCVFGFNPAPCLRAQAVIELNSDASWETALATERDPEATARTIENVLSHEIGHALGLDHPHGDVCDKGGAEQFAECYQAPLMAARYRRLGAVTPACAELDALADRYGAAVLADRCAKVLRPSSAQYIRLQQMGPVPTLDVPTVRVEDQRENGVGGIIVVFTDVSTQAGVHSVGEITTTDADGYARLSGWTVTQLTQEVRANIHTPDYAKLSGDPRDWDLSDFSLSRRTVTFTATIQPFPQIIFFASNQDAASVTNQFHIWQVNPDGSGLARVTAGNVVDLDPELSPDGTKLAFSRSTPPNPHDCRSIWVRDLATGQETPITQALDYPNQPFTSTDPTWSPDSKRIAFNRANPGSSCDGHAPGTSRIWLVDYSPTIGAPVQLSPASGASRLWGSWAPDGTNILYGHQVGGFNPFTVWKVSVSGGVESQVIPHVRGEYDPKYSADGSKFVWTTFRHSEQGDIYTASTANPTTTQFRVTGSSGYQQGAWAPDGTRLVFVTTGTDDIWIGNADGSGFRQLTSGPSIDRSPWWGVVRAVPAASITASAGR